MVDGLGIKICLYFTETAQMEIFVDFKFYHQILYEFLNKYIYFKLIKYIYLFQITNFSYVSLKKKKP